MPCAIRHDILEYITVIKYQRKTLKVFLPSTYGPSFGCSRIRKLLVFDDFRLRRSLTRSL